MKTAPNPTLSKLLTKGPRALSSAELLTIIHGQKSKNTQVFTEYAPRFRLVERDIDSLANLTGWGLLHTCQTVAALELGRRYSPESRPSRDTVHLPSDIYQRLAPRYASESREHLIGIYLDSGHHILREVILSIGTLTQTFMHPREIFTPALQCHAASVILVHNHPSGDSTPSTADLTNTERVRSAGQLLGIDLLDHIIIGESSYSSLLTEDFCVAVS
jgi:DNA repair protein RadC